MFDILLPADSDQPLYEQIYRQIRTRIQEGKLAHGTRVPSVRTLQNLLNISKTPIETACQMLIAEGYLASRPRSGLYVSNPYSSIPGSHSESGERLSARSPNPNPLLSSGESFIDFDPSAIDPEAFPLTVWSKMMKQALIVHEKDLGRYGEAQGERGLRAAIAEYLRNSRGVTCSPDQIVVGTGMAYSVGVVAKLLDGIRRIAVEDPGFKLIRDQFAWNGWEVVPIPVREKGIALDELERSRSRLVYVTPSHQFPTGEIMPFPERERLLRWASSRDGFILEDDYDSECRYVGKPIPSLQSLDSNGNVIYVGTFSKTFSPSLRMNYMVLPVRLLERLRKLEREVLSPPSRVEQWAMQAFMEQGHWYRHLRRVRVLYRAKHRHLIECVQRRFGDRVEITGKDAGLHIQVSVLRHRSSRELVRLAAEAGVRVYDFCNMHLDPGTVAPTPTIYMGFAGVSLSDIDKGVKLLKEAWFEGS
ncbi:PLP-dependent aminotransferase family protein [Cohnella sp. AR92]|uniref:MocR-like pyridoxine biosynthesis transcription factor PdxR n=1 Tax=Cohnella sp. AR92 TaxID=648716 RepID=UPI000F8F058A|nr:PLP-dependent aminotransferase family protein [Cohnella sp. AR92]RUS43952.1 PLP-dependent aminotransferase family protein [Cohnella sp. AR92]